MTDALTRAARAVANYEARDEGSPMQPIVNEQDRGKTRAAILSFLSGEDVVKHLRAALITQMYPDNFSAVGAARICLATLRALAQEDGK